MQVKNNEWTVKKHEVMRAYNNKDNNPETGQPYTEEEYLQKYKEYSDKEMEGIREAIVETKEQIETSHGQIEAAKTKIPGVKVNRVALYKESISLYRDACDLVLKARGNKKDCRDMMAALRKSHG